MENSAGVLKLKRLIYDCFGELASDMPANLLARYLLKEGYIHKSQACDYMERCPKCYGGTIIKYDRQRKAKYIGCHFCSGNGFVLKENV